MITEQKHAARYFKARCLTREDEPELRSLTGGLPQVLRERLFAGGGSLRLLGATGPEGSLQAAAALERLPADGPNAGLLGGGTLLWPMVFAPEYQRQRRFVQFCMAWQRGLSGPQAAAVLPGSGVADAEEQTALYLSEGMVLRAVKPLWPKTEALIFMRQYLPQAGCPTRKVPLAKTEVLTALLESGWVAGQCVWGRQGLTLCLQPLRK